MNIFLTGSTGFLGGKLIKNLLINTENILFVLVRNVKKAEKLISQFDDLQQKRIHLIQGDIIKPKCGLSENELSGLSNKIDIFYHLAALVKFDIELKDELHTINYTGTKHVLELAESLNSKKFFYISTAYTLGKNNSGKEALYNNEKSQFNNPYEESKAKAEHLVFSYKNRMDISIFRPSIIVGDSKTGEADSQFTLYGFMRALDIFKRRISRNKYVNDLEFRLVGSNSGTSNLVPVDYVADILSLASTQAKQNVIYHITNPIPSTNLAILNMIKEALQFTNLKIIEPNIDFTFLPEELQLNSMVSVFNPYLNRDIHFEDKNTQELINHSNIEHLNMSDDILRMIINAYFTTK